MLAANKKVKWYDGHFRVYPAESVKNKMRSDVSMRRNAHKAEKEKVPVLGIKGTNALLLAFFKVPFSFCGGLHACCVLRLCTAHSSDVVRPDEGTCLQH